MGILGREIKNSGWRVQQKAEHLMKCVVPTGFLVERILSSDSLRAAGM